MKIMEISKADWKLYRERVSDWQEHYMEQLIKEYVELLTSPGNASDHFGELEKRIKQDKKHPGVLIELRKSTALWDIAYFVRDKVITMNELEGFSEYGNRDCQYDPASGGTGESLVYSSVLRYSFS